MSSVRLVCCLAGAGLLGLPAAAGAASPPFDLSFGVSGLRGTVTADVSLVRNATAERPATEIYGGSGIVLLALRPGTSPSRPAGRLRWQPGNGGRIAVPASLRFSTTESAGRADGSKRRCHGRSARPQRRQLVHVLRVERQGDVVRIRWAIPLPRLGTFGCGSAGKLPAVIAENTYPARQLDHQQVRIGVTGSQRFRTALGGGRTRNAVVVWNFRLSLVRLRG